MDGPKNIPRHVAIIMDGNGRWAKRRGLPKIAGHSAGVAAVERVIRAAGRMGVKVLTLYTFSTENWNRPKGEVDTLFKLMEEHIDRQSEKLRKNDICVRVIGRLDGLPQGPREKILKLIASTRDNKGLTLNLAINYGGRAEIVDACRALLRDTSSGKLKIEDITEEKFAACLYTRGLPDPDLMIRTSGESRLSNFLLWQSAYTEIYVTDTLWPDFSEVDFETAIDNYLKRERRYGG